MKKNKILNIVKRCLFMLVIAILIMFVWMTMLRYEVEGEKNLPYGIDKVLIISTVEGEKVEDGQNLWNINLKHVSDFYVYIDKYSEQNNALIKSITFENFKVDKEDLGEAKILRPTGELKELYTHSVQNYISDKIVYTGDRIDDLKNLQISNNGGVAGFRLSVENLGKYISNEDTEIVYNGKLLQKIGINNDKLKAKVTFDILIETSDNITYKGNISLNIPVEKLSEEGSSSIEITDFDDVIFKRLKK